MDFTFEDETLVVDDVPTADTTNTAKEQVLTALRAVIGTRERIELPLGQLAKFEKEAGKTGLLAGSDMAVPDSLVEWAKAQIAAKKPATFPAKVVKATLRGARSGQTGYIALGLTAKAGAEVIEFAALKPRGKEFTADQAVKVSVSFTKDENGNDRAGFNIV